MRSQTTAEFCGLPQVRQLLKPCVTGFEDNLLPTKSTEFRQLQELGFETPNFAVVSVTSLAEFAGVLGHMYQGYADTVRAGLPYEIDGLVVELDRASGDTCAVAYKFPHETAVTTLRRVEASTGRTGHVTPVGVFDPVMLGGASVARASLATWGRVLELGLCTGDEVVVAKRNDIIPRIESVRAKGKDGLRILPPTQCPSCEGALSADGEYLTCTNAQCGARTLGEVANWLKVLGVLEWGDAVLEALYKRWKKPKEVADLYAFEAWQIADTDLSGRKIGISTAAKMLENLRGKMLLPLHTLVGALSIPLIGASMAKTIADHGFDTLDKMRSATAEDLVEISGIGVEKAQAFVTGLAEKQDLVDRVLARGVRIEGPITGKLKGKSVCMTGFRDPLMKQSFERAGGTVKSGVSKGLTYLVAKEHDTSSQKAQKAREYGTEVLTIPQMWALLEETQSA